MHIASSKIIAAVAGLVVLAAGASVWRTMRSSSGQVNATPFVGIGQRLAEETAKAVHNQGRVVAIIAAAHQQPGPLRDEWEVFRRELQKYPGIILDATETVAPDPNDPQPDSEVCPITAFKGILERHGQAAAVVFLIGLPDWHWLEEKQSLPAPVTAKFIVVDVTTMGLQRHYEQYFSQGFIAALISRRYESLPPAANPKTPRDWFDKEYQIFTPQNYDSLPK